MDHRNDEMDADRKRRCPRLGHEVGFRYCLMAGEEHSACWKTIDCWWEIFDVHMYLKNNLPEEQYQRLAAGGPPKNKVTSLLELVEQARKRTGKE